MSTFLLSKGRTRVTSLFWPGRCRARCGLAAEGTGGASEAETGRRGRRYEWPEGGWRKGDGGRLVPATSRFQLSQRVHQKGSVLQNSG